MSADIHHRRSELKNLGRFADAIPLQLQILQDAQSRNDHRDIANGWNYLSMLYYRIRRYGDAEAASLAAIEAHKHNPEANDESLATYEMLLARILAAAERFDEAIRFGDLAIHHYSTFHTPVTNFLRRVQDEVAAMRSRRDELTADGR